MENSGAHSLLLYYYIQSTISEHIISWNIFCDSLYGVYMKNKTQLSITEIESTKTTTYWQEINAGARLRYQSLVVAKGAQKFGAANVSK